jgi:hypothetical protein
LLRLALKLFSISFNILGVKYDRNGKHLKAIEKGKVPPRGGMGLIDSQEEGCDLKSKVLGKGGDRRFHAMLVSEVLHLPDCTTEH